MTVSRSRSNIDFHEVYRGQLGFMWRVMRYLGVPAATAEDAVQDAFIVVHRRLHEFDGRALQAWLFAIARGIARNHLRSARRAERRKLVAGPPSPAADPEDAVAKEQGMKIVFDLLEQLDERKRMAFLMCDVEGLKVPQVAEILGIPVNTAYSRLRAARQQFNLLLQAQRQTPVVH